MSVGFGMEMKDAGVLRGGQGRVCVVVYICWKVGSILEFRGAHPLGLCEIIMIHCTVHRLLLLSLGSRKLR